MASLTTTPAVPAAAARAVRRGFTLIEMMVVVVLIVILASMTLSGLAVARQRARLARTKSTIRKLHEIVVPHYESYLRRRVPFATTANARTNALNRLKAIRELMVFEMPDSGSDVGGSIPSHCQTGPVRAYATSVPNTSAECLYLIVSRGGLEPDLMEQFRGDEIGDVDRDGLPEFLDGWNRPIIFLRWAPGFSPLSAVQVANAKTHHDPFDPQRVDLNGYALVPLIVSGGADGLTGLQVTAAGWRGLDLTKIVDVAGSIGAPESPTSTVHRDNVTNHDLNVK
jgi:prepilin-type N-terminal cleavage/methylation domain-containing protein